MSNRTVPIDLVEAEKIVAVLDGFSAILRDSLPQRLFDTLDARKDDPHMVFEPLRYDLPMGPEYVAELVDSLSGSLSKAINEAGGGSDG